MAATIVNHIAIFTGHNGREKQSDLLVMQNSDEETIVFDCMFEDGSAYTFSAGDVVTGNFTSITSGVGYIVSGTITPTTDGSTMAWVCDPADVGLPDVYNLSFRVETTGGLFARTKIFKYTIEAVPNGIIIPPVYGENTGYSRGNTVVVVGDSIENLYSYVDTTSPTFSEQFGRDWPTFAALRSSGKFQLLYNAGIGGESTADYILRWDADVTPHAAQIVIIGGSENDIQESIAMATIILNVKHMVGLARRDGAIPVIRTTMPHPLSDAVRTEIGAFNAWARRYAADNSIVCLDFWEVLVDHTTGEYQAAYSADGIHPNEAGADLLGQYAISALDEYLPERPLSIAGDPTDGGLLAPTPLFLTDVSGTPTTWNAIGGSPAGVTRSMVTDALVPGRMARIAAIGSSLGVSLANNSTIINTDVAGDGDLVEVTGVVTSDGGISMSANITIAYNDGISKSIARLPFSLITTAMTRATYVVQLPPLPTGFLYILITFSVGAGTGIVDFSYPAVRNLTREQV